MAEVFAASHFDPANYAASRSDYPAVLYDAIDRYHAEHSNGNTRALAIDIGTGPGQAVRALKKQGFERVIGVDPSESMIATAKQLPENKALDRVEFRRGLAEDLPFLQDGSVDLIASGTAAHWFPQSWWREAYRVTKPGATIALFVAFGVYPHPSTPRFPQVRDLMNETKSVVFDPWMAPGNVVVASSYDTLPLPEDDGLFSEVTRLSWNRDGKLEQGQEDFALSRQLTVDEVIGLSYSLGPVNTYNQKHPELFGTPRHPLEAQRHKLKDDLGFGDSQRISIGQTVSLLLLTRK